MSCELSATGLVSEVEGKFGESASKKFVVTFKRVMAELTTQCERHVAFVFFMAFEITVAVALGGVMKLSGVLRLPYLEGSDLGVW